MKLTYLAQLIVLIIWVFVVGALFMLMPDKRVAGALAGVGFLVIPIILIKSELKKAQTSKLQIATAAIFLVCSALPIFLLRVLNWETDFQQLSLFGLSADFLHKSSNVLYFFMVAAVAWNLIQEIKSTRQLK